MRTRRARAGRWKRLKRRARRLAFTVLALAILVLVLDWYRGGPPENPEDLCAIFGEKRSWYRAARRSSERWNVPEAVQLAVIYQESSFRGGVRPPRKRILWIFPGPRPSSAFGYGQVLDATWRHYQDSTGRPGAERNDFADVADFVGWYGDSIHRQTGIARDDAYRLYLAYHEGPGGYARGSHRRKRWLLDTARRVEARAGRYQEQYDGCRKRLARWWVFW